MIETVLLTVTTLAGLMLWTWGQIARIRLRLYRRRLERCTYRPER